MIISSIIVFLGVVYFTPAAKYPKLICEGNQFSVHTKYNNRTTWRCTNYYRETRCRVKLNTYGRIVEILGDHNHATDNKIEEQCATLESQVVTFIRIPYK